MNNIGTKPHRTLLSEPKLRKGWHLAENPMPPCIGKGQATVEPIRDINDISTIKDELKGLSRDRSLFIVGINVGLRAGDLLGLRWAQLLDDKFQIRPQLRVTEQKTGNLRKIAINESVKAAIMQWRDDPCSRTEMQNFVWPGRGGRKMTIQRLHQLVNCWCALGQIEGNFGTHTLRKTYGYHLRKCGYEIEVLMKIFNHSSPRITLRYIGIDQDEIDEANLKLHL